MDAFAWPGAVLIFLIFFVLLFRGKLDTLFDRTNSLKLPGGVHAEMAPTAQNQSQAVSNADDKSLFQQERLGSPPIADLFEPIEQDLKTRIRKSVPDRANHFDWAIRLCSMFLIERNQETNYRLILGSQIQALKLVAGKGGRAPIAELRQIYERAVSDHPQELDSFNFEDWSGFLLNTGYLAAESGQDGDQAQITPLGRAFLGWMAQAGIAENKPF